MIQSMTAFGRADGATAGGELSWELRSVNHRFLDVGLRLPELFRPWEPEVRERIGRRFNRGRIDVSLRYQASTGDGQFELDETLLHGLVEMAHRVEVVAHNVSGLRTVDLLRWPGVVRVPEPDPERLHADALGLLDQALAELASGREREGTNIHGLLTQRLDGIDAVVVGIEPLLPELATAYRARLAGRLAELRAEVDPQRLEQEIVLFAQRADVHEEIDRLKAHVVEVRRVLQGGEPVGRRLDFLMQELNREANTLGSKATDLRLTNAAVELKVLIEQMREQVQNVE